MFIIGNISVYTRDRGTRSVYHRKYFRIRRKRLFPEKRENLAASELPADHSLTRPIDVMDRPEVRCR